MTDAATPHGPSPEASVTWAGAQLVRWRRPLRVLFVLYACVLFTGTHWPGLGVPSVIHRPDLVVHFSAYGLWTVLFHLAGWIRPFGSVRAIRRGTLIALAYALLDELSQGIPILRRVVALDDAIANIGGVALGTVVILVLRSITGPVPDPAPVSTGAGSGGYEPTDGAPA